MGLRLGPREDLVRSEEDPRTLLAGLACLVRRRGRRARRHGRRPEDRPHRSRHRGRLVHGGHQAAARDFVRARQGNGDGHGARDGRDAEGDEGRGQSEVEQAKARQGQVNGLGGGGPMELLPASPLKILDRFLPGLQPGSPAAPEAPPARE